MSHRFLCTVLAAALLCGACGAAETAPSAPDSPSLPNKVSATLDLSALGAREVFEPQLLIEADGTLILVWRQKGEAGFDLYAAHRGRSGELMQPVRINDEPGTVYSYPHDEMRPAIASGPDGRLGVVWTDDRAQIRAAVGRDHGRSWDASIRLDQAQAPAYRSFTAADFDKDATLHAIWIDSRLAPRAGAEEPADLFYARLLDGDVTEVNLTEIQDPSICGCCRPALEARPDGRLQATFRNTTADGYRDIFTITGSIEEGFSAAARVGPPLWKLSGCPMSGPLAVDDEVLWADGSTGKKILMLARVGGTTVAPLFDSTSSTDWSPSFSPRGVVGAPAATSLLLVPGRPSSRILTRSKGSWSIVADDIPKWATAAAALDGQLLLVGATSGKIQSEVRPLDL